MSCSSSSRAVPPVDSRRMPRAASARAKSTMPVLSETDSSACVTVPVIGTTRYLDELVLGELGAQRVAVEAEHLGRVRLVAVRALEHRREERPLDVRDHHVVDAVRRLAVEAAEILVERALGAAADFVAAIEPDILLHAASASLGSHACAAAPGSRSPSAARRAKNCATAWRCAAI